jgi:hypothetical protein
VSVFKRETLLILCVAYIAVAGLPWACLAQTTEQPAKSTDAATGDEVTEEPAYVDNRPDLPVSATWKQLQKNAVWIDIKSKKKSVIVAGEICHREGPLEMFACPRNTKEYESVVVVNSPAFMVHTALLAIGAKPGQPVKFSPEYQSAKGPIIDVYVDWLDENGKVKTIRGQQMVKHMPTGKAMSHDWVFSGSEFREEEGKRYYLAEGGELICVSNFSTATMDLPVKSSQGNAELVFGAFQENIPPLATKIHLRLVPRVKPKTNKAAEAEPSKAQAKTN